MVAYFLFLNFSHIMKVTYLATAENWIIFLDIFHILYLIYRRSLISILGVLLGTFVGFLTLHWYVINMLISNDMYLSFLAQLKAFSCAIPITLL